MTQFDPTLFKELPETYALLSTANFVIHESVERVTLHGSRGPRGFAHPDSDLDLALVVGPTYISEAPNKADFFHEVLVTTLRNWQSRIEIDLAAVFDRKQCGLKCLDKRVFNPSLCPTTVDCMGIYKIRDGRAEPVSGAMLDCSKMYPLMTIWEKGKQGTNYLKRNVQ